MNLSRRASLQHPFAALFHRAVDAISAALTPGTERRGKMRIQWKGATAPDLAGLSRALWESA